MEDLSMKTNYNERREVRESNYLKEMYQTMISGKVETQELEKMASYLAKVQKADGSWSVIDDYKVDSDIRVAYAYMPTYFATAALIAADLKVNFKKDSIEKNALVSGLIFATGRNLVGHGYDATASLLEAIAIYKNAGVYKWMRENREFTEEFCNMFEGHIQTFRHLVESGRTVSDSWNLSGSVGSVGASVGACVGFSFATCVDTSSSVGATVSSTLPAPQAGIISAMTSRSKITRLCVLIVSPPLSGILAEYYSTFGSACPRIKCKMSAFIPMHNIPHFAGLGKRKTI